MSSDPTPQPVPATFTENPDGYSTTGSPPEIMRQQATHVVDLTARVQELEAWKREAIAVESEWDCQAVANELGLPLGCSIRKEIMPAIRGLNAELARRTLRWSTEPPTVPGDWHLEVWGVKLIVRVERQPEGLVCTLDDDVASYRHVLCSAVTGARWAGPIASP